MKKLFYTDPRKALWMATEFGVRYENKTVFNLGYEIASIVTQKKKEWQIAPIIITPCSHHVFEPKEEDVVEIDRWYWQRMRGEPFEPHIIPAKIIFSGKYMEISIPGHGFDSWKPNEGEKPAMPYEIIQRENKAFFMPDSDD